MTIWTRVWGLAAAVLMCAGPVQVRAQEPAADYSQAVVVVTGRGVTTRAPDFGRIQVFVMGEGDTQVEALASLESQRSRIVDGLQRLDGAQVTVVRTDDVRIERVMGPDCEADDYNLQRSSGVCEPQGYAAAMDVYLRVSPAAQAGSALSLAAELGSTRVSATSFGVDDIAALRNEAARAAFADARRQAEQMAASSGGQLGRILRIQNGAVNGGNSNDLDDVDEIVITGSRVRPAVQLTVTPEPAEVTATLGVVFELLP